MGELLKEFLKQSIVNLHALHRETFGKDNFTEEFLRRVFRQLHTLKGTSNTFNLSNLAHLAHEIEDLLQALQNHQIPQTAETTVLIQTGFEQLLKLAEDYLAEKEIVFPQDFTDLMRAKIPNSKLVYQRDLLYPQIPEKFLSQLAAPEKTRLSAALKSGKTFHLLEVSFPLATFYENFKTFKEALTVTGEVIAVSPTEPKKLLEEIAFQVFYVTDSSKAEIEKSVESFKVKFIFESYPSAQNSADNLAGMIANLIADGEKIARRLEKQIVFETSLEMLETSNEYLILLNEIVSHLLHNAIDHAIESAQERIEKGKDPIAKIEIIVSIAKDELILQIKDDGRGIEIEKISERARQKGYISEDRVLDEAEALEITFQPGFSTRETVTEISGRGVGLDAVRALVEKSGGRIEVKTMLEKGTAFSIYLPQN